MHVLRLQSKEIAKVRSCGSTMQCTGTLFNHLETFFPNHSHVCSRFGVFAVWLENFGSEAAKTSISFCYLRDLMLEGCLEFANNPKANLLSAHGEDLEK